jgi:YidC/Oxa1 family membrane protein insertase
MLGNWGWAIVALVVLLKIAFYWLNAQRLQVSMAKMKAINPKVMEMRERYKDKPQQMQQEMMRIYREEKVNPLGGCLPIWCRCRSSSRCTGCCCRAWRCAMRRGSAGSPTCRQGPVLHPAAADDGSTMFQTWLNPTPPDPVQAKLMWFMPLIFSVMFFFFPAGLVLYWLTNNILGIAQQWFINRSSG